jgi:methylthioribose-1-phosphate isomerase
MAETARCILDIDAVAGSHRRLRGILMGTSDLARECRIRHTPDRAGFLTTLSLCVLAARAHGIPFYVAAPWSTIDAATPTGADIEIEHRHADELGDLPTGVRVWNPAFDVTPRELISGYLTDRGFVAPPFSEGTGV